MDFAFTVEEIVLLGTPLLISPNNTSAETAPTFEWSAVAGAAEYTLVVYDVENAQIAFMLDYSTDGRGGVCWWHWQLYNSTIRFEPYACGLHLAGTCIRWD